MTDRKNIIMLVVAAAAICGSAVAAYVALGDARRPSPESVAVSRGDVRRVTSVAGKVRASQDVALAFERGGVVSRVTVAVGDKVAAGQIVAELGAADVAAQLAQAQAALAAAQARLDAVKRGSRPEELGIQAARVDAARTALAEAQRGLADRIQDAYGKADDAVRGKADPLFTDPNGTAPHPAFFFADALLEQDLGLGRVRVGEMLAAWQAMPSGPDVAESQVEAVTADLGTLKAFLESLAVALDKTDLKANPSLAQTTLDGWKASVSLARANVAAAVVSVNGAVEKVRAARAAVSVAVSEETLKGAAPASEDVAGQEAVVRQAAAAVQAVQVQLGKTVLRSPLDGIVTRQDAKVGALAAPGAPLVAVISSGAFEIEAVVPESEVASVVPGAAAAVTLDAYGTGETFDAQVVSVDPALSSGTGQEGYRAVLRFRKEDGRIKDGMTADVRIDEGSRTDVVAVPRKAIITRDGTPFVLVVKDGATEERKIETGLVGSDGRVEVVSGLAEGERIAAFGN